jgi:hypothetical protein
VSAERPSPETALGRVISPRSCPSRRCAAADTHSGEAPASTAQAMV